MHLVLDEHQTERQVDCPNCKWEGSQSKLVKGEFMELTEVTEVFCPECDKYIGFIQHESDAGEEQNDL